MKRTIYFIILLCITVVSAHETSQIQALCHKLSKDDLSHYLLELRGGIIIDINHDGIREQVTLHANMGSQVRLNDLELHTLAGKAIRYRAYEPAVFTQTRELIRYEGNYYIVHYYDRDTKTLQFITYIDRQMREEPLCEFAIHRDKGEK